MRLVEVARFVAGHAAGNVGGDGEEMLIRGGGVDSAGDLLWLADSGNDRIVKYSFERAPMPNQ